MADLLSWLRGVLDEWSDAATDMVAAADHTGHWPVDRVTPDRIQARVEAERAILDLHRPYETVRYVGPPPREEPYTVCEGCTADMYGWFVDFPCDTLRLLAYGHRFDAEGYDPAWAPEGVATGG